MLSQRSEEATPFRVLFVCTGNICRSPIAERLARGYLGTTLGAGAAAFRLESAGTHAVVGNGVHPDSARVLVDLGGDPEGFVARQLTDDLVNDADLVLAMARGHRHAVLRRLPRGLSRTFTLREAAELAALVPADAVLHGATVAERCRSLVGQLAAARARRPSGHGDDIRDPISEPLQVHAEAGELIAESILQIFGRMSDLGCSSEARGPRVVEPFLSGR